MTDEFEFEINNNSTDVPKPPLPKMTLTIYDTGFTLTDENLAYIIDAQHIKSDGTFYIRKDTTILWNSTDSRVTVFRVKK